MAKVYKLLLNAKEWILDILFPPICLICQKSVNKEDDFICGDCFSKIPLNTAFFCGICRARIPSDYNDYKSPCHKKAPYILAAAADYKNEVVRELIWQLKYRKQTAAARPLARILFSYLRLISPISPISPIGPISLYQSLSVSTSLYQPLPVSICPIPLHPSRERERGFNQGELIAKFLLEKLNRPRHCEEPEATRQSLHKSRPQIVNLLRRRKRTESQAELDFEKRKENITGAFLIRPIRPIGPISSIILLDDVCTSGATLNEAAKTLKAAGAQKIIALVVAKA